MFPLVDNLHSSGAASSQTYLNIDNTTPGVTKALLAPNVVKPAQFNVLSYIDFTRHLSHVDRA